MNRPESPLLHAARISTTHPRTRAVDVFAALLLIAVVGVLGAMVGTTVLDILTDSDSSVRAFSVWLVSGAEL